MGIRVQIAGSDIDGQIVPLNMYQDDGDPSGLIAYTRSLYNYVPETRAFVNSEYGVAINQNAGFGGTPIGIHDGEDNTYWTGAQIVGTKVTFDSTDRFNSDAQSVKVDNPNANDVWQFAKGSSQDLTGYAGITLYINIDKDWSVGDSVSLCGYDVTGDTIVGNAVLIEDYVNEFTFDVWQPMQVPFVDLGLVGATVEAFRMTQVSKQGKSATFYIDDFQIEETGTPIEFKISASPECVFEVEKYRMIIVAPLDTALVNNSMPALSYDQLLNVTLVNGIRFTQSVAGESLAGSPPFFNLSDLIGAGFDVIATHCDGTNTMLVLEAPFRHPHELKGEATTNYVSFTIGDDLTSFLKFNIFAIGHRLTNKQPNLVRE